MNKRTLLEEELWNYSLYKREDGELILEVSCQVAGAFYDHEYKLKRREKREFESCSKRGKRNFLSRLASKIRRGPATR